jgi:hypothetical protein
MLKLNYAISCVLASAFVLSTASKGPGDERNLGRALDETLRAIEVLAGFQSDAPAWDDALRFVKSSTEAPILDGPARDARLMHLRDEVNSLAQQYGSLAVYDPLPGNAGAQLGITAPITTGLSGIDRTTLRDGALGHGSSVAPATQVSTATQVSVDPDTFSADPVRQARASYRAGRYADCLKLTEALTTNPEAMYWSACALEKLERFAEAIVRFRAVVEARDAGSLADRAKLDLEFLEWKKSFRLKLPAPAKGAKEGS